MLANAAQAEQVFFATQHSAVRRTLCGDLPRRPRAKRGLRGNRHVAAIKGIIRLSPIRPLPSGQQQIHDAPQILRPKRLLQHRDT